MTGMVQKFDTERGCHPSTCIVGRRATDSYDDFLGLMFFDGMTHYFSCAKSGGQSGIALLVA